MSTEVYVADAVANKILQHHRVLFLNSPVLSVDGKRIIGAFLQDIVVFEAATGKKLSHLPIGQQTVQSLHVLPHADDMCLPLATEATPVFGT